jgi:hypothetical protein
MKTNVAIYAFLLALLCGCNSQKQLPKSSQIDVFQYGSYIEVHLHKSSTIKGELIALDSNEIVVLNKKTKICEKIALEKVKSFNLKYANSPNYGPSVPLLSLLTLSHGYYMLITLPLNLIVTMSVTLSGEYGFSYSHKDMTYEKLKMFARFPQGIPPNIDIEDIK